jgi:Icc protein
MQNQKQDRFQVISKRLFFFFYLITLYCTSTLSGQDTTFRFVFITDIHQSRDSSAVKGFTKAVAYINRINPDFIIAGGDMVMNNPQTSYEKFSGQFQQFCDIIRKLSMPIYPTFGNHDVVGLYQPHEFPKNHADYGKNMFLRHFRLDAPYYSFDHNGWHFIVLDDIRVTGDRYEAFIDSAQMVWLKNDLTPISSHTPIVVTLHIPMVSVYQQIKQSTIKALSPTQVLINTPAVLNLFKDKNLRLVLQGHLHIVEEIIYKSTRFITGGAVSGAWWRGAKDGFQPGLVLVSIDHDCITWEYLTYLTPSQ